MADTGNSDAQLYVAGLYLYGIGTKPDFCQVLTYYGLAAKQGNIDALVKLGDLYYWGQLTEQDYEKTAEYYKEAFQCLRLN